MSFLKHKNGRKSLVYISTKKAFLSTEFGACKIIINYPYAIDISRDEEKDKKTRIKFFSTNISFQTRHFATCQGKTLTIEKRS
jgi:hypothetical protein